jgi:hypothetical protein
MGQFYKEDAVALGITEIMIDSLLQQQLFIPSLKGTRLRFTRAELYTLALIRHVSDTSGLEYSILPEVVKFIAETGPGMTPGDLKKVNFLLIARKGDNIKCKLIPVSQSLFFWKMARSVDCERLRDFEAFYVVNVTDVVKALDERIRAGGFRQKKEESNATTRI